MILSYLNNKSGKILLFVPLVYFCSVYYGTYKTIEDSEAGFASNDQPEDEIEWNNIQIIFILILVFIRNILKCNNVWSPSMDLHYYKAKHLVWFDSHAHITR